MPFDQKILSRWDKFRSLFGTSASSDTWLTPAGQPVQRSGGKRTDLMLVWSVDANDVLEEDEIREHWPGLEACRRLGSNLFQISGVGEHQTFSEVSKVQHEQERLHAKEEHFSELSRPENDPRIQAEKMLATAQAGSDRAQEAIALTDLGCLLVREGNATEGQRHLAQALELARQCNDTTLEYDALANLGTAELATGKFDEAVNTFEKVLVHARAVGDPFMEKMMLSELGMVYASIRQPRQALEHFENARRIAREQGDQRDEAEISWSMAIFYDEQGQRDEAIQLAQTTVNIYDRLGSPQAQVFAEQLEAFRRGNVALTPGPVEETDGQQGYSPFLGGPIIGSFATADEGSSTQSPSPLRMAYTAVRSMAKFITSGFKTVSHEAHDGRLAVCGDCRHHTGVRCKLCGCFTAQKAWMPHERCPAGKWPV